MKMTPVISCEMRWNNYRYHMETQSAMGACLLRYRQWLHRTFEAGKVMK